MMAMGEIKKNEGGYLFISNIFSFLTLTLIPSTITTEKWTVSARKPLHSSADSVIKDLQVDTATADKRTNIHSDSISSAERIDRSDGRALYRSESSFILVLQIWEDYRYTVTALRPTLTHRYPNCTNAMFSYLGWGLNTYFYSKMSYGPAVSLVLVPCLFSPPPVHKHIHSVEWGL